MMYQIWEVQLRILSGEAFERARRFLLTEARPLERELYRLEFEGGPEEAVLEALAAFANGDGGLGHGLEPDSRSPSSSPLATAIGLRTLIELGKEPEEALVQGMVRYLRDTWNAQTHVWRPVALDVNSYPHAPWWHDENGSLERTFDGYVLIPRVLILAGLWQYEELVPREWLEDLTQETVNIVASVPLLGEGGGSDLEYAQELAMALYLPEVHRQPLLDKIQADIGRAVVTDPTRWGSYCLTPLRAVREPPTPGAELVEEAVQRHLDYQLEHQSGSGAWEPTWSWGGAYPEDWERARQEWRGVLTLQTLRQMAAFGRLERD